MHVEIIFLNRNSHWPQGLDSPEWQEMKDHWVEFKSLMGLHLPGAYLHVGELAIGGLARITRDKKNRRKILNALRNEGFEPYIMDESPL